MGSIPINLVVMNELNDRVNNSSTQGSTLQSSQVYTQASAPVILNTKGSKPNPVSAGSPLTPLIVPVSERVPEVVTAEERATDNVLLITAKGVEPVEHNAAPGAEGRRIFLPPPIPGFVAGTANIGMFEFSLHIRFVAPVGRWRKELCHPSTIQYSLHRCSDL